MRRKAEQQERMERLKISIDKAKESLRLINEGTIPKLQNASHAAAHGHGVQCLITL